VSHGTIRTVDLMLGLTAWNSTHMNGSPVDPNDDGLRMRQILIGGCKVMLDLLACVIPGYPLSFELQWSVGIICVFSVDSVESFEYISDFIKNRASLYPRPLVLVGINTGGARKVPQLDARIFAESLDCPYFETSLTNQKLLDNILRALVMNVFMKIGEIGVHPLYGDTLLPLYLCGRPPIDGLAKKVTKKEIKDKNQFITCETNHELKKVKAAHRKTVSFSYFEADNPLQNKQEFRKSVVFICAQGSPEGTFLPRLVS